jgi:hypothetical protein
LVEKWILPRRSKLQKLVKKTEGILGVNVGTIIAFQEVNILVTMPSHT